MPRTTASPSHAKAWWRHAVLLQLQATGQATPCPALAALAPDAPQLLAAVRPDGLWLCGTPERPAPAQPSAGACTDAVHTASAPWATSWLAAAQAAGIRTLVDGSTGQEAAPAIDALLHPAQVRPLVQWQDTAPDIHARLACALKAASQAWPVWALPQPLPDHPDRERHMRLAAALQLSVRGTALLRAQDLHSTPAHAPVAAAPTHCSAQGWLQDYLRLAQWRRAHAPLLRGSMKLLPVHAQLLGFVREHQGQRLLCLFNWSERYVREPLALACSNARLVAGSGVCGGRIVNQHIDCDPWGGFFALLDD